MDLARLNAEAKCDGQVRMDECRHLGRREAWERGRTVVGMDLWRLEFVTVAVVGRTGLFALVREPGQRVETLRKGSRLRRTWRDPLCRCHLGSDFMWIEVSIGINTRTKGQGTNEPAARHEEATILGGLTSKVSSIHR